MKLGILSDAHGNVEAFELALRILKRLGAERFHFLGDAVGYLPGSSVVERLQREAVPSILGNHEAMLLSGRQAEAKEEVYRLAETRKDMPIAMIEEIRNWRETCQIDAPCGTIRLMHGSPNNHVYGYVYPDTDLDVFEVRPGSIVLMGNTHRPFVRESNGARFINVGSCGLPRDAGSLGAACLLDDESGAARIIRFDIAAASAAALKRCGSVHPSVAAIYQRPTPPDVVGEIHV